MEMRRERHADILRQGAPAGEIIRRLHWQCWRDVPAGDAPGIDVSVAELVEVLPVLIESGSVGLVWPRLAHRADELGAIGAALQAGYEAQVGHNARVEEEIARVVGLLRAHSVEPVLIKGYAMARLYPSPLVRSAGDIDLVVRDGEYDQAIAALAGWRGQVSFHADKPARRVSAARGDDEPGGDPRAYGALEVDLHRGSLWYGLRGNAGFFDEAVTVWCGTTTLRVPRAEDHLRALCLHFLRHGAVRPMRLCDIAVLLESGPRPYDGMDWDRVLRGTAREREQVAVTLRLAETLLGATTPPLPDILPEQLPAWLVPAVLRQWGESPTRLTTTVLQELRSTPKGILKTFRRRWPDPITATLRAGSGFSNGRRLPVQAAAFARQLGYYSRATLWRQIRERSGY